MSDKEHKASLTKHYTKKEIQLVCGSMVNLEALEQEVVNLQPLVHSLSNQCRYIGHTYRFYSVAQHSVLASLVAPKGLELACLFHDLAEAFVGDMSAPIKVDMPSFGELEDRVLASLCNIFSELNLSMDLLNCKEVVNIDYRILATEKRDLMLPSSRIWTFLEKNKIEPYYDMPEIDPLLPVPAYELFMHRLMELTGVEYEIIHYTQMRPRALVGR